jgi:hypothetical protein
MDALHLAQLAVLASGAAVASAVATIVRMWLKRGEKSTGRSNEPAETSGHDVTVLIDDQEPVTATNVKGAEVQRLRDILGEDGDVGPVASK